MKKKTTTKKKPAARPIPPPPPGWEIVGKDDPRLNCLPAKLMSYFFKYEEWLALNFGPGDTVPSNIRSKYRYALPIAQPSPPRKGVRSE